MKVSERNVRVELEDLAGAEPKPTSEQMAAAFAKAGFKKAAVEVSADITPTGLAVDAIEAAAPVDDSCIVGQVRDGKVAISVLPVLDSGKCFVGGAA
ncbi:DUF6993 domain-containing protein [Arthrobacter mangrovi]|uniref:DUF6993 domain-containing protein n=1 Tax=Arthrobacter mangrovi TaxID=2966350 RepID=UPI00222FF29A|nr:hypothetical protein [Arthrobacter mangrovi]